MLTGTTLMIPQFTVPSCNPRRFAAVAERLQRCVQRNGNVGTTVPTLLNCAWQVGKGDLWPWLLVMEGICSQASDFGCGLEFSGDSVLSAQRSTRRKWIGCESEGRATDTPASENDEPFITTTAM